MKNFIDSLGFILEGAARLFDFAGVLSEDDLHERHDGNAINKDWKAVGADFHYSTIKASEEMNGCKKKVSAKKL